MQLLPLLICPQERYLLFKIPQDYKYASSCQFAVHTPRILCWNKQKQKKLIPVASRYFILRRRHSTAVADFPPTIHGFHFTVRFDKNVPAFGATFHSSQFTVDTSKFTATSIPSKTSLTVPNQPARCMDAKLQTFSYQHSPQTLRPEKISQSITRLRHASTQQKICGKRPFVIKSCLGYTHASHEKSCPVDLENKKSLCQLMLQESYLLFMIALTTPMQVKNTVSSIH